MLTGVHRERTRHYRRHDIDEQSLFMEVTGRSPTGESNRDVASSLQKFMLYLDLNIYL
ncbi:MAG TPA: hypothetical protein PK906_17220 [Spirochaetota bacterium]|nr:hypothetical protein [Spirochaetota bacterium]